VLIDTTKELPSLAFSQIVPVQAYSPDIFELFYLARPDSILDGISVQESRQRMGLALADTIIQKLGPNLNDQIDAVIPVPETGYVSALALASRLNVPLALGLVKNTYCHRSFIVPTAEGRLKAVRRKLNTVRREFVGKNVLIVDDSIVRGGTSREIIKMAREAGAKKVIFASSSPAIRYVTKFELLLICYY
jgi:amidophosphoribosyltransferase